jgi:hypothetical protein
MEMDVIKVSENLYYSTGAGAISDGVYYQTGLDATTDGIGLGGFLFQIFSDFGIRQEGQS